MATPDVFKNLSSALRILLLPAEIESVRSDVYYLRITNYVAFIGYTILVWDHIISFPDEVRYIWRRNRSTIFYLFLINRYITPLAFIGNLTAYFGHWSKEHCNHFVRYEGSCTIIALLVTALMMYHRVCALYSGQKLILGGLAGLFCLETAIMAWLMTHGIAVTHAPGVYACTMIFDPNLGEFWPSLSAWIPLVYDTIVILLTLWKCMPRVRKEGMDHFAMTGHIVRTLLKDGLMYYSVIFCINFVLAIMIMTAKIQLKNITAQIEQLLTVAMMSRITISLRREAEIASVGEEHIDDYYLDSGFYATRPRADVSYAGSHTVLQHVSVIPRSHRTSFASKHQTLIAPSLAHSHTHPQPRRERRHNVFTRFLYNNLSNNRVSRSFGAVDTVLSISPAHTAEAIEAEQRQQRELAIIRDREHELHRDSKVPIVSEHYPLSPQDAYELRTLRPSAANSGSFLRL